MGRWNRRYLPRRKYNYQYQDFPPTDYDDEYNPVIQENSVPSWEIEFCKSVGIPWHKVVNMKKYFCCYDNVVKWDDSAGQEAFHDAKTRYWAKINGLPCDSPLPDPCQYIDEVDWNAKIDPEMILDLDREFFNPDKAKVNNLEDNSGCTLSQDNKNPNNGENAWEIGHAQRTGTLKTGQSWGQWDDSKNFKNLDNPWEENQTGTGGSLKGTGWIGGGNDSWGWNTSTGLDNTWKNSWNHDRGSVGCPRQIEWGNNKNGFWSRNAWNDREHNGSQTRNVWIDQDHKLWNSGNYCDPRQNNTAQVGGAPKNKGSGQWENKCSSWKNSGSHSNLPMHLELERSNTGRESFYGGSRKRECSSYHTSRFKSSRFQGDEKGAAYNWRKIKKSEEYK